MLLNADRQKQPVFEGVAPGRLDVMGGIADYSGALVLQMPIANKTRVRFTPGFDYSCLLTSTLETGEVFQVELDYRKLLKDGEVDYAFARQLVNNDPKTAWAAYVVGCALVLEKEKKIHFTGGTFEITSGVPLGKGVSSSASIEVATLKALQKAYSLEFRNTELPVLAQRVENLIVGAPCGLMDQLACYFGKPNHLLPILCQPDQVFDPLPIPDGISFVGIDSGVRHSVAGASYSDVRCATFMGYTLLLSALGVNPEVIQLAKTTTTQNLPYGGYLTNIPLPEFEHRFLPQLPQTVTGKDFINRCGASIDTVTEVDPHKHYPVRTCTSHPVYEHHRVQQFRDVLVQLADANARDRNQLITKLGNFMYESHESYTRCGLGSDRTDELVTLARSAPGVYGAKITGGGNGGTVCFLVDEAGLESVKAMHRALSDQYQQKLVLFNT